MNFAISGDTRIGKTLEYDVVIVGAGLAGLYAALHIDEKRSCVVLAKESTDISSSWLAQGGIAAAINRDDTPELHLEDTVSAGAGLCDEGAVKVLVNEGPSDIGTLVTWSVPFDLDEYGVLQFTREGGHNMHRILHAGGDATGRETIKALSHIVYSRKNITFSGHTCLFDLIVGEYGVIGVVAKCNGDDFQLIKTNNVIIATGGVGQVYKSSTNPPVSTGDGIAAAMRAGAELHDIEFVQFHPTGLYDPDSNGCEFLISEAVRGEGGILVNDEGVRFMVGQHELAELAPRDIVARGIVNELKKSGKTHAYIDITSKTGDFLKQRFPTIYNECLKHGIDITRDKIPVCPVQHYMMGGIKTDLDGKTNIEGLYSCGESASTGVHGANRLASNSMLECLVFGRRAALHINSSYRRTAVDPMPQIDSIPKRPRARYDLKDIQGRIQHLMSSYCYVIRNMAGLEFAYNEVSGILSKLEEVYDDSFEYLETLNIATVARAILDAARKRPESIGSHYVED